MDPGHSEMAAYKCSMAGYEVYDLFGSGADV